LSKIVFLSHNFSSRYAIKPIKDSRYADYNLVSKKKKNSWVSAQNQVYLAKKAKRCPHCDITHRELQIWNEFFFYLN